MPVLRRESSIERATVWRAKDTLHVHSVKLSPVGSTGWPDRLFLLPGGRVLFVEFKRPGEKPTEKQVYIHELLRRLGHEVQVHDDADEAIRAITRAVEAARVPAPSGEVPS